MATRASEPKAKKKPKEKPKEKPAVDPRARLSPRVVPGVGPIPCDVMLVGEGPGKSEDKGVFRPERGLVYEPFVGPSGQLLMDILLNHSLPREHLYITNVVKQRIADDETPNEAEIELFRFTLMQELAKVQPRVVIAAGGTATRWFLGPDANLELLHGLPQALPNTGNEGSDFPGYSFTVVPCYHPASMLHDSDNAQVVYWDYAQAAKHVRGQIDVHHAVPRHTRIVPLPERLPDTSPLLGIDTEFRHDGSPLCLTLSFADRVASYVPVDDHEGLRRVAQWSRNPACTIFLHNAMADLKPLRLMDIDLRRCFHWNRHAQAGFARAVDTMVLLFEQGRLHTQSLKTVAYRLFSILMRDYMDLVGPVQQRMAFEYLDAIPQDLFPDPEPTPTVAKSGKLAWSRPWGMGRRIRRILSDYAERGSITDHEKGVDLVDRWDNVDAEARRELTDWLGDMPLADLSHCDREEARHYACQDADVTRLLGIDRLRYHQQHDLIRISTIDHGALPLTERMQSNGMPASKEYFIAMGAEMRQLQAEIAEMLSMVIGREINPKSSDQVAELLYRELKLDPVMYTRGGKPSTGKKALQHLRKENMLVDWIMQSREYGKMDDAFCENIADRITRVVYDLDRREFLPCIEDHPNAETRAFYQLMVTRVKTARLAAKNFNALAIPSRTKLGRRVQSGFRCRSGRAMLGIDQSQIEMRVMAHESQDPKMLEVYNRRKQDWPKYERDLHILTASEVTGRPKSDWADDTNEELAMWRTACKSTGFGILMGIMGSGLSDQMRLYGLNPADWPPDRCDEFIREWLKVFVGVRDYQLRRKSEARRTGGITDMFGRRFELPQVHCPLSWIREEALRQAHALPIQAAAQSIMKQSMALFDWEELPVLQEYGYCEVTLQVHDALYLEADEWLLDVAEDRLLGCLTSAERLGFEFALPIEADAKQGPSWGELH